MGWLIIALAAVYVLLSIRLSSDVGKFLKRPDELQRAGALVDDDDYDEAGHEARRRAQRILSAVFGLLLLLGFVYSYFRS
jgi:hypothetical protein